MASENLRWVRLARAGSLCAGTGADEVSGSPVTSVATGEPRSLLTRPNRHLSAGRIVSNSGWNGEQTGADLKTYQGGWTCTSTLARED